MTATLEIIETQKAKPMGPIFYHRLNFINIYLKAKGRPYKTICGIRKTPNPNLKNMRSDRDLGPMEKCVICQSMA